MAQVVSIREITHVLVPTGTNKHGPALCVRRIRCEALPREAWARVLSDGATLPSHRGAGPCGTRIELGLRPRLLHPMRWSIWHLVKPLREFYRTYRAPLQFGAKTGPRGRKVA